MRQPMLIILAIGLATLFAILAAVAGDGLLWTLRDGRVTLAAVNLLCVLMNSTIAFNIFRELQLRLHLRHRALRPVVDGADRRRAVAVRNPVADKRARDLLLRLLTPEQRLTYLSTGEIMISTERAGYLLRLGARPEIYREGLIHDPCIQLRGPDLPDEDRLIALLLMIRTDEDGLWERFVPPLQLCAGTLQPAPGAPDPARLRFGAGAMPPPADPV
jgi:hypothetical protein